MTATYSGQYRDYGAWLAETRHRQAGWDLPGHLPWVVVSSTPCPGGEWSAQADGPAQVCRHKHFHPDRRRVASGVTVPGLAGHLRAAS